MYFIPLLFFVFQPDILHLRPVLHQQSICRSLPSSCSRSNTSQGSHQGQEEELMNLLDPTCIQLIS